MPFRTTLKATANKRSFRILDFQSLALLLHFLERRNWLLILRRQELVQSRLENLKRLSPDDSLAEPSDQRQLVRVDIEAIHEESGKEWFPYSNQSCCAAPVPG